MLDQFSEFQDRILTILDRVEAILLDPDNKDVAALSQARWEVTRLLREYQLFKHSRIFDPLINGPDTGANRAKQMKADCIRMGEDFHKYVLRWSVVSILDHWAEYYPSAMGTLTGLRIQLAKERAGVTELLELKPVF